MAYTLVNKCAKICCKRTILVQLIVEDVVTCFTTSWRNLRKTKQRKQRTQEANTKYGCRAICERIE